MKSSLFVALSALLFGLASCASPGGSTGQAQTGIKHYTSDKCIVTDNKLGSMGDPVTIIYKNQEVKFCCKPCVAKFNAHPDKYLAKIK